ncbi:hypothetical protein SRABI128_04836 [Microbacterium sp. Bi128]|nr:hypothetical protein SRABI128_04836 [Microbacterium sp. Bi128]
MAAARDGDLARHRRPGSIGPPALQHGTFDLAARDAGLDDQLGVVLAGDLYGGVEALEGVHLGDSHGRPCPGRLDEYREAELVHALADGLGIVAPLPVSHGDVGTHVEPGRFKDHLHEVLVHADGGRKHARAHVAGVGQFQEALDGAVFAEGPVQQREDDVDGAELLRDGVRGCDDQLVLAADLGQGDGLRRGGHLGQRRGGERPLVGSVGRQNPLAGLGDPDRDDVVFVLVDGSQDAGGCHAADGVLAGAAAEQHRHAGFGLDRTVFCGHVP